MTKQQWVIKDLLDAGWQLKDVSNGKFIMWKINLVFFVSEYCEVDENGEIWNIC